MRHSKNTPQGVASSKADMLHFLALEQLLYRALDVLGRPLAFLRHTHIHSDSVLTSVLNVGSERLDPSVVSGG